MELLYNPDAMSEQEIKATFVARQPLVDELITLIERQPDGAGVQHVVIIAPRGMGKTTVLLMLKFAIKDRGLAERWQALKFPEESYGINDLADLWLTVLNLLASETNDHTLHQQAEELKRKYPQNEDLQEAALAVLKDWRRAHGKRLVLLVENFDQILEQINDERDNARLRDVLMNDGTIMLIGGATTFFKEARAYDQPLYNFFKLYDLTDLRFEQIQDLLRRRAMVDALENFDATLQANASRLRTLEYFTGGNPRLVLMLYRVVTQSDLSEVRRGLEKLLDEVTPYYKAKLESLPPQQRKILDHIARISGITNEGLTPGEIAIAVRLPPNQVSAQLKRLSEIGYVRTANLQGRSVYYTLSEPLYAIWHQMRLGRDAHQRMGWLVNFLRVWYDTTEMGTESDKLQFRFRIHLEANRLAEARDTLEHHRYLAEAMQDSSLRARALENVIRGHLQLGDGETISKDLLPGTNLDDLSAETLAELQAKGLLSSEQLYEVWLTRGNALYDDSHYDEALAAYEQALALQEDDADALFNKGVVLGRLEQHAKALAAFERAITFHPDHVGAWYNKGIALGNLGRYTEALAAYDQAITLQPDYAIAWDSKGSALMSLERYPEALIAFDQAMALQPDHVDVWINKGVTLERLKRYTEALAAHDQAIALQPDHANAWYNKGVALGNLGKHAEALAAFNQAITLQPDHAKAWTNKGVALECLEQYTEALAARDQAIALQPNHANAWFNRGTTCLNQFLTFIGQENIEAAKQSWAEALFSGQRSDDADWPNVVSGALLTVAQKGQLDLARQLITEAKMEEQLFPLTRAIDYVQSGDEALIEERVGE